ncbi:MAG TPA: hypothetical protein VFZ38_06800 [Vicinamibacterales bacterium]
MTYRCCGELSDSWLALLRLTAALVAMGAGARAMHRAGLIWGQVGLVR